MSGRRDPANDPNKAYKFIVSFLSENGYSPSIREVMIGAEYQSTSTTNVILNRLVEQGRIRRIHGIARGISLVKK